MEKDKYIKYIKVWHKYWKKQEEDNCLEIEKRKKWQKNLQNF